jgi:hypothetical protein
LASNFLEVHGMNETMTTFFRSMPI